MLWENFAETIYRCWIGECWRVHHTEKKNHIDPITTANPARRIRDEIDNRPIDYRDTEAQLALD